MKNIKTYESFSNAKSYIANVIKKGGDLASNVWSATKVESQETKIALGIFSRMIKGEEVSDKEKKFLRAQSKDIALIFRVAEPIVVKTVSNKIES